MHPWLRVRFAALSASSALLASGFIGTAMADAPGFRVLGGSARPHQAFFDRGGVTIRYRFAAERPVDVAVRIVRRDGGRVMRGLVQRGARPGVVQRLRWGGLTWGRDDAPDGHYEVRVGRRGHRLKRVGGFFLRGHVFPVRGRHGTRGRIGEFGAPRSGGRTHEGFDVLAACGTKLVAARGGRVLRRGFDPVLYGNFVLIDGREERRAYFYSHLARPAEVRRGDRVRTGTRIGVVGQTGNARTTPCHLHFELRSRGAPLDPEPHLRAWDRYS